jgi:hypothetical protein
MAAGTLGSRPAGRRSRENLLARCLSHVDGRHGAVRPAGIPRGTPNDPLVRKVLERMMIDEVRRLAV